MRFRYRYGNDPFWHLIKDSGVLALGNLVTLFITIIGYPVIARLYTDIDYSEYALFQSIFLVLLQLSSLGYNEAILLTHEKRFKTLLKTALLLVVVVGCVFSAFIYLDSLSKLGLHLSNYSQWFLILLFFLGGFNQVGLHSFLKLAKLRLISSLKVLDRVIFQVMAIGLSFTNSLGNGLVAAMASGQLAYFLVSMSNIFPFLKGKFNVAQSRLLLSKYKAFPFYSLPARLVERVSQHLPILILPVLVGKAVTGQYAMALRLLSLPEMILGASLGQVLYTRIAETYNRRSQIKPLILKAWQMQFILGMLPLITILFAGEELFSFALGTRWSEAGKISQVLCFVTFGSFISTPTSSIFAVFNKQFYGLVFSLTLLFTRFASLYFGVDHLGLYKALYLFVCLDLTIIIVFNLLLLRTVNKWEKNL